MKNSMMKSDKKKMDSALRWIVVAICIVAIAIALYSLISSLVKMSSIRTIDVNFSIGDYVGFNLDQEVLNFGTTIPGGTSTRIVELVSDKPLKVHITVEGQVKDWMKISDNDFIMDGKKEVGFAISAPVDMPKGNYTGKVTIFFMKP